MSTETYEGWENVETWAVANAIDNNEAELRDMMAYVRRNPTSPGKPLSFVKAEIAAGLKSHMEFGTGRPMRRLRAELRGMDGSRPLCDAPINWASLAEHYLAKASEEVR